MPREQRREQLLDAALTLIVEQGYGGLSMEAVAREAGIAKTVVYGVFANQGELLEALFEREQARTLATVAAAFAAAPAGGDAFDAMHAGLVSFLEGVARAPYTWRLILIPADGMPRSLRDQVERQRERYRRQMEPIAAALLPQLGAGAPDVDVLTHLLRGNAEQLARLTLTDPQRFSPERLAGFVGHLFAAFGRG